MPSVAMASQKNVWQCRGLDLALTKDSSAIGFGTYDGFTTTEGNTFVLLIVLTSRKKWITENRSPRA
jgi:hypothetical protein